MSDISDTQVEALVATHKNEGSDPLALNHETTITLRATWGSKRAVRAADPLHVPLSIA